MATRLRRHLIGPVVVSATTGALKTAADLPIVRTMRVRQGIK